MGSGKAADGTTPTVNLTDRLTQFRAAEREVNWQGTFAEYFERAINNHSVSRLSHGRVYDMVMAAGFEEYGKPPLRRYHFFDKDLFGIEKPIQQIVEDYLAPASQGLEVRKRILLLMGPVGGGKSTVATLLKRGMEQYSRTEQGAVYAIVGCPMHEEPLHLIPDELRPDILRDFGISIEGDLCPSCRMMLETKYAGRSEDVPVQRIQFSEKNRVGVGTFAPSSPKDQDISELTGSIDLATVGTYGSESDPRAYRFDGELNVANRGVMEFIELLKVDEKFLYSLLSLSQEQNIKTGRFAMIYADEVILSHTNEHEYNSFMSNKRSGALQDRIIVVKVPYNLRVSDEIKVYEKLLAQSSSLGHVHIAPNTLRVAATFAILSRLEPSKREGMSLMKKLKLYDGEEIEEFTQRDVRELQEECPREGMDGISPRFVINVLSGAVARDGAKCVNPIDALRALKDGLEQNAGLDQEHITARMNLISQTRQEFDELAKKSIQKAFVYAFEESAKTLLANYLDNVEAFCNKQKLRDPVTDEETDPDEKLMRSIEEQIGVTETAKKTFREEILIRLSSVARRGQAFTYESHDRLREAIEKKLFADLKDVVKITTSVKTPDEDQLRRINDVVNRLIEIENYCVVCANEHVRYVGTLLSR